MIADAEVRYRVEQLSGGAATAIGFASFAPSDTLVLSWEWALRECGGLPVGARITYWWAASGEGRTFEIAPTTVVFEGPRIRVADAGGGAHTLHLVCG